MSMSLDPDKSTRGLELVSLQAIFPDEFESVEDPAALNAADAGSRWASADDCRAFRLRVRPEIQLDMNFAEVGFECMPARCAATPSDGT